MASLDFVYDLAEKLENDKIEYVLITLQRGEETYNVNIFSYAEDSVGEKVLKRSLAEAKKQLPSK